MSKSTTKGLRATIIRIKRTIEDVESESSEEPADSLILEIPKKKPRHFKDLSLEDKGEEEEKESQSKPKEEEEGLERRIFKFVGSSREGDVENPLSLEDFMKVRTELRKAMKARAAEEASKDEQAKKRTKQDGDRPVNARVSFVSEKKSVRVLDLTEGGSGSREAKGSDTTEVVTCNGVPMKVTKKKKTVYDLYYCYERVKTKKKASSRKTEDDDDDEEEEDDDVEYEEAIDDYDKMDSFYETIDGEAKMFRIDDYDGDIFFRNFDDFADEEEDLKNDYDYDSNAEDNSSNTYPDEDDFDSDSDSDPFGHSDNDDDDDESKDEDDDYGSYVKWNKSTRKSKSSKTKKNLADEISMILGGYVNRKSNTMDLSDDDDDDVMYFDGDDDKEQYFKYAYDEDYDNDDDDDDSYF